MMQIRRITGRTMSPELTPGAIVIIRQRQPQLGDIVLALENDHEVIKRLVKKTGAEIVLENDQHPKRRITISRSKVLGAVLFVLPGPKPAPRPHKPHAKLIAGALAAILVVMATAQLMSFDSFIELLNAYHFLFPGPLVGAVLVTATVAALPYLLHMALSPLARIVSAMAGWLVACLWVILGVQSLLIGHSNFLTSGGHLGSYVATPVGVGAVMVGGALFVLTAFAQWYLGGLSK